MVLAQILQCSVQLYPSPALVKQGHNHTGEVLVEDHQGGQQAVGFIQTPKKKAAWQSSGQTSTA